MTACVERAMSLEICEKSDCLFVLLISMSIVLLISMCCAGDTVVFNVVSAHVVDDMLLHSALTHTHTHTHTHSHWQRLHDTHNT